MVKERYHDIKNTQQTPINELDKFLDGALSERVARAIGEIAANIMDINTQLNKVRKLTITLTIKPNKSRKAADITTNDNRAHEAL